MKTTLSIFAVAAASISATSIPTFEAFLLLQGHDDLRNTPSRKHIYDANIQKIRKHNASPLGKQFQKGINQFTDWTVDERRALMGLNKDMLHDKPEKNSENNALFDELLDVPDSFPESWDWTKKGACTPVKNQGQCGSCWAFAGSEAIEGALFLATGKLESLSPQAFLDCVSDPNHCGGTGGCEGNTFDLLFKYAHNKSISGNGKGGAVLASDYAYTGKDGKCHDSEIATAATVTSFVDVPSNNYTALMAAVMNQPVAVGVAAMNWGDYQGGVYPNELCDGDIDHAVLLVGWGTDPGLGDYWKIKNSWGSGWGEDGYIRLQKNTKFCTEDSRPSDGLGCHNTTKKVEVCGACAIQYAPSFPTGVALPK